MHRANAMIKIGLALAAVFGLMSLTSCTSSEPSSQQQEDKSRQSNYDQLVKNQPAHTMDYSPTRATKNFWIDTWNQPGKLSYVYLMNANGDLIGYYVFKGLPVSYCVSLIPPYQLVHEGDTGGGYVVPGPSVDGTFASSANCNTLYGEDATTGAYIEFTVGMGMNTLVYDQPLARQDVVPLGQTTIADVQK